MDIKLIGYKYQEFVLFYLLFLYNFLWKYLKSQKINNKIKKLFINLMSRSFKMILKLVKKVLANKGHKKWTLDKITLIKNPFINKTRAII